MSLILDKFSLNDVISFDLYVSAVLQQDYDYVTVEGLVKANQCHMYGVDAYSLHAQVFRLVPAGTMEDNPDKYLFLLVKHQNAEGRKSAYDVVGLPWINPETIRIHKQTTAIFEVPDIAQEDINLIRDTIARFGYKCDYTLK